MNVYPSLYSLLAYNLNFPIELFKVHKKHSLKSLFWL